MPEDTYLIAAVWVALALVASLVSIRLGISVALLEIGMGIVGGNFLGLQPTPWIDFLAGFGAVLLTFLAGAEIDPDSLRRNLWPSLGIGGISFFAPFFGTFAFAMLVLGWPLQSAEVAGIALSTNFLVLLLLGGLATVVGSEAVLPAYVAGLVVAGVFASDKFLVHRMRATAFSLLTPFYFPKAGLFVALPAVGGGAGLIAALLAVKVATKTVGVWPTARLFRLLPREANYTTLMMSTGLTFGSISALFGLTHGYIDRAQYTVLVSVVIASAVVPTLVAQQFFHPHHLTEAEAEEVEAAGEIDVVPEYLHTPEEAG